MDSFFDYMYPKQEKSSPGGLLFSLKGRVFVLFYPKWSVFQKWEGVPAAEFGDEAAGGK